MAAPEEKLRGKQAAAIAALLSQRTIAEAAHQVGMGERTLLRWLQEDCAFQAVYRMARRHVVQHAIARVQQATSIAVETLGAVMQDPTAAASARVSAAKVVLETALRGVELEDLEARIAMLEQHIRTP
jgi:predicted transcriptional regulator